MRQHSGALERKWYRQLTRPYFSGGREKSGLGTRLGDGHERRRRTESEKKIKACRGVGKREKRERTNMRMPYIPADGIICVIHIDSQWKCCIQSNNHRLSRSERTNTIVQTLSRNILDDQTNMCGSPEQNSNIILSHISSASPSLMHNSAELPLRAGLVRAS